VEVIERHSLGDGGQPRLGFSRQLLPCLLASCVALAAPARAETDLPPVEFDLQEPLPALPPLDAGPAETLPSLLTAAAVQAELASADQAQAPEAIATRDSQTRLSFGEHAKSIKTELGVTFAYMTAVNLLKIANRGSVSGFSFKDEGLFGKDTSNLGVDKLVHAHNSYMLTDLLAARIRKNTGTTRGTALSGAVLSSGFMLYSEIYDGFKGGFGFYDLAFNSMGAGFAVLRDTTPGLEEKLDFRVLLIPNRNIYSPTGKEHYRQLRYLFALKLSGFEEIERSPLRFVELHAGYYATGFTRREERRGELPERKPFVGVGLNISELLFGRTPRTRVARAGAEVLDYWQPPYTYIHAD
jgi:hypothetical protein